MACGGALFGNSEFGSAVGQAGVESIEPARIDQSSPVASDNAVSIRCRPSHEPARVEGQRQGVRSGRQATAWRPSDNWLQQPWFRTRGGVRRQEHECRQTKTKRNFRSSSSPWPDGSHVSGPETVVRSWFGRRGRLHKGYTRACQPSPLNRTIDLSRGCTGDASAVALGRGRSPAWRDVATGITQPHAVATLEHTVWARERILICRVTPSSLLRKSWTARP